MLSKIKEKLFIFIFRMEIDVMATVYATLIIKGVKDFADVPDRLKDKVKQILIDLDCADLVTE